MKKFFGGMLVGTVTVVGAGTRNLRTMHRWAVGK